MHEIENPRVERYANYCLRKETVLHVPQDLDIVSFSLVGNVLFCEHIQHLGEIGAVEDKFVFTLYLIQLIQIFERPHIQYCLNLQLHNQTTEVHVEVLDFGLCWSQEIVFFHLLFAKKGFIFLEFLQRLPCDIQLRVVQLECELLMLRPSTDAQHRISGVIARLFR